MKKKLKEFFGKVAKVSKKKSVIAAASATFVLGGGIGLATMYKYEESKKPASYSASFDETAAPKLNISEGTTYWKLKDYDIVVKVEPDANKGLTATVHSVDINSEANRELMATLKGYKKEVKTHTGGPRGGTSTRWVTDTERVQDWELQSYCGYEADAKLEKRNDKKYVGTFVSPFNGGTYGLDVKQTGEDTVKFYGYLENFPLIWASIKAERVDSPPPACKSPWAP